MRQFSEFEKELDRLQMIANEMPTSHFIGIYSDLKKATDDWAAARSELIELQYTRCAEENDLYFAKIKVDYYHKKTQAYTEYTRIVGSFSIDAESELGKFVNHIRTEMGVDHFYNSIDVARRITHGNNIYWNQYCLLPTNNNEHTIGLMVQAGYTIENVYHGLTSGMQYWKVPSNYKYTMILPVYVHQKHDGRTLITSALRAVTSEYNLVLHNTEQHEWSITSNISCEILFTSTDLIEVLTVLKGYLE